MSIQIITLLISLLPFILIIWYISGIKKYKDVSHDMRYGEICYSCKDKIDVIHPHNKFILADDSNLNMCISCKRDESIQDVLGFKRVSYLNKLKRYLCSSKYKRPQKILLILLFISLVTDVLLAIFTDLKGYNHFVNAMNCIYWSYMFLHRRFTSIRK